MKSRLFPARPILKLRAWRLFYRNIKLIFLSSAWIFKSLNSKFDALLPILSELNGNDIKIDAICLQETWLSTDQDASIFNIPGYQLITLGKKCSAHSGLAIYLSDSFSYLIKSVHDDSELWDGMFIEVSGESLCDKIIIGNIYRPPRSNNNNKTIKQFWEELTPVISNISKNSCHIIITGDFNIDLLLMNDLSFKNTLISSLRMVFFQISQYLQDVADLVRLSLIKCFANLRNWNII